jgi:NADPH-dependent 2,4-dienoyl-CoA reductase/sulfur reductase-like enzyme
VSIARPAVVIVGASVAGSAAAEALRAHGFAGRIVLLGAEPHLPYDRPPLSKQVLTGARQPDDLTLLSAGQLAGLEVEPLLGHAAVGLRPGRVELADGREVRFDRLIIATGLSPRRLAGQPDDPRVLSLRDLGDAIALRDRLGASASLLVIGGGFIGAEVAASARQLGLDVTIAEADPAPMGRVLGERVGALCARLHEENGVTVRAGAAVRSLRCSPGKVTAELADGERLAADMAVVGLGAAPNTGWLSDVRFSGGGPVNGSLTSGLACDDSGAVRGLDGVFAVGDVARWPDPELGGDYRTEHWTSARTQADIVARRIAGVAVPGEQAPDYVWSDQYRVKIQVAGRPEIADRVELRGDPDAGVRGRAALYFRNERLTAAVTFGAPRVFVRLSAAIGSDQDVALRTAGVGSA